MINTENITCIHYKKYTNTYSMLFTIIFSSYGQDNPHSQQIYSIQLLTWNLFFGNFYKWACSFTYMSLFKDLKKYEIFGTKQTITTSSHWYASDNYQIVFKSQNFKFQKKGLYLYKQNSISGMFVFTNLLSSNIKQKMTKHLQKRQESIRILVYNLGHA